ncbi:hypothetical protein P5G50_16015 [Leifsonia sp. F6_8S_P_1B]|uniref:Uncharacterized protein n=1 Tax=Leifsonia williamsii TaxID=3035919 RepID=A0ABT8KFL1_9MICO|nr:hypothetical protein [Leifsonia williamsii]MDN4615957.1 hypothetical protein [Leifsonia williamsii]
MRRRRPGRLFGALVACVAVAVAGLGAARVPAAAPSALCIPILLPCSSPTPTPTPTQSDGGGAADPSLPTLPPPPGTGSGGSGGGSSTSTPTPGPPTAPGAPATPTPTPTATPSGPAAGAPVFTQPPAQLGSRSLSFTGIPLVAVVTVPLADGSRIPVLELSADGITVDGFSLTVRKETGPVLATTADRMALRGKVHVYVNSLTATDADGRSWTLGATTPPPADGLPPQLVKVTLGLVGVTADSIAFDNPHQHLTE